LRFKRGRCSKKKVCETTVVKDLKNTFAKTPKYRPEIKTEKK